MLVLSYSPLKQTHVCRAAVREAGVTSIPGQGEAAPAPAAPTAGASEQHEDKKPRVEPSAAAAAVAAAVVSQVSGVAAPVSLRPFAVVDEVADGSPAAAAGIQLGDQLCRWVWGRGLRCRVAHV